MKMLRNAGLPGIWMSMLLACSAQAEGIVSNVPVKTGFRLDMTALPPSPDNVRLTPPRLAPPYGSRLAEGHSSSSQIAIALVGPEPIRTVSPALEGLSAPQYQPTSLTNDIATRMDIVGLPSPVSPVDPDLPASGTNSLRNILGSGDLRHVFNSLNGICGNDGNVAFERGNGRTQLTFETGLAIVIDDTTGSILTPPDLPSVSDEELAGLSWERLRSSGEIGKWRAAIQRTDNGGNILRRLSEVRLDEIFRVSDKAFVAWRLVTWPAQDNGSYVRLVHWVDVPSGGIVATREEYNSAPPVITVLP